MVAMATTQTLGLLDTPMTVYILYSHWDTPTVTVAYLCIGATRLTASVVPANILVVQYIRKGGCSIVFNTIHLKPYHLCVLDLCVQFVGLNSLHFQLI